MFKILLEDTTTGAFFEGPGNSLTALIQAASKSVAKQNRQIEKMAAKAEAAKDKLKPERYIINIGDKELGISSQGSAPGLSDAIVNAQRALRHAAQSKAESMVMGTEDKASLSDQLKFSETLGTPVNWEAPLRLQLETERMKVLRAELGMSNANYETALGINKTLRAEAAAEHKANDSLVEANRVLRSGLKDASENVDELLDVNKTLREKTPKLIESNKELIDENRELSAVIDGLRAELKDATFSKLSQRCVELTNINKDLRQRLSRISREC